MPRNPDLHDQSEEAQAFRAFVRDAFNDTEDETHEEFLEILADIAELIGEGAPRIDPDEIIFVPYFSLSGSCFDNNIALDRMLVGPRDGLLMDVVIGVDEHGLPFLQSVEPGEDAPQAADLRIGKITPRETLFAEARHEKAGYPDIRADGPVVTGEITATFNDSELYNHYARDRYRHLGIVTGRTSATKPNMEAAPKRGDEPKRVITLDFETYDPEGFFKKKPPAPTGTVEAMQHLIAHWNPENTCAVAPDTRIKISVYLDDGVVFDYHVTTSTSAREHVSAIIKTGYRHSDATSPGELTHFPPHRILKVKMSGPGITTTYYDTARGT